VADIGRLAVSSSYRGHGIGSALIQAALNSSVELGFSVAVADVPTASVPFCRKHGFLEQDADFAIGGVPHRRMTRELASESKP
jgi:predicted GNAT family N-acyltransferase